MSRKNNAKRSTPATVPAALDAPATAPATVPATVPVAPVRITYAVSRGLPAPVPGVLIPIGSNHNATSVRLDGVSVRVPGIPTIYTYADSNGSPIPIGDSRIPAVPDSLRRALRMLAAAENTLPGATCTNVDIVESCRIRYAGSFRHGNTGAAMPLDAADFAIGFTCRILDSIPRSSVPGTLHAATSRLPGARSRHSDAPDRIAFARTLAMSALSVLESTLTT